MLKHIAGSARDRAGFILPDALVAMAIASLVVVAVAETSSTSLALASRMAKREQEMLSADRVAASMTLLVSEDLDRRLGTREIAGLHVEVQRPEPGWYTIRVADAEDAELLATAVYRLARVTR